MAAYIVRRLLLMIPTLFGIILLNFLIVQVAPGGPVEQMIAKLQGMDVSATSRFAGGGSDTAAQTQLMQQQMDALRQQLEEAVNQPDAAPANDQPTEDN